MTEYFYSPHTGEHIETATPADWMGKTHIAPPPFNAANQGAFFRNGSWVVETALPPQPQTPQSVTMRQARLALLSAGLLAAVNAAIAAMPGVAGEAARIEWEFAQTVERDSPLIVVVSAGLNLTAADIDDLLTLAATL